MPYRFNPFTKKFDIVDITAIPAGTVATLTGDSGGAVGPDGANNIDIDGNSTQGVEVVGDPITHTLTIQGINSSETQKGVVELATSAETITGTSTSLAVHPQGLNDKLGTQTNRSLLLGRGGAGNALASLGAATNGQIPIGSTGADPVLATLTAGTGISITNGAGSITVSSASTITGTVATNNTTPTTLITFPLSNLGGAVYSITVRVAAITALGAAGTSYFINAGMKTNGVAATLIGTPDYIINEDVALDACDVELVASGNNAVVRVTGLAGLGITWAGTLLYTEVM